MQNASPSLEAAAVDADDPGENLCPMALVEAFETLEASERGLRAAKQKRNLLYKRLQEQAVSREVLPVTTRRTNQNDASTTTSSSLSSSQSRKSVEVLEVSSVGYSCLPSRWRLRRRMRDRLARLSRRTISSSSSSAASKSPPISPVLPHSTALEAIAPGQSVEDYEEYKSALADVDSWRTKVIQAIRLVEELKGSVRRSILANMDPEEAARYTSLRQSLLAAAIVDLWVYDSERMREKFAVSVLDHPADVFSAIAHDIDLLVGVEDSEESKPLAVAYRTLAVLARLTLPSCPNCSEGDATLNCQHAVQFIAPIVEPFDAVLEAFWDQRFLYQPLLKRLEASWEKLMRGSERYRDLIDLCQSEPVCLMSEDAKRRKFHSRVRKWQEAKARAAAAAEAAAETAEFRSPQSSSTADTTATQPPLPPPVRYEDTQPLPSRFEGKLSRRLSIDRPRVKRRPRSPSLLLHVSITPEGLEA